MGELKPDVPVAQTPFELARLVEMFESVKPKRVLEVGCWHGGTLWHWLQPGVTVVAIDDEMRGLADWQDWAKETDATLIALQGMSQAAGIVEAARHRGPYDFVFIDAGHTYEEVRQDVGNYLPMVAPGGILALHDILPRDSYGVSDIWAELKNRPGMQTVEVVGVEESPHIDNPRCGIGAVYQR